MNQVFLKDLANETLRGRVEAGRSGGGNNYGYDVVRRLGGDREPVTGERAIHAPRSGHHPAGVSGFCGWPVPEGHHAASQQGGHPRAAGPAVALTPICGLCIRGTGLLNNELYIGRLVWSRLRYVKDPATGRRISRLNPPEALIITEVPEHRIIAGELWERVKARQGEIDQDPRVRAIKATRFWEKKRQRSTC